MSTIARCDSDLTRVGGCGRERKACKQRFSMACFKGGCMCELNDMVAWDNPNATYGSIVDCCLCCRPGAAYGLRRTYRVSCRVHFGGQKCETAHAYLIVQADKWGVRQNTQLVLWFLSILLD